MGLNRSRVFTKKRRVSSLAHAFVSTAIRDTSVPPSPISLSDNSLHGTDLEPAKTNLEQPYSSAQLSRAAAQSVRLACQNSSIHDAFLIVHSLRMSERCYKRLSNPRKQLLKDVAIDFGKAVPSCLSIHSLIHALYRKGYTDEAIGVVSQVLADHPNLQLRERTVEIISKSLIDTDLQALRDGTFRGQLQNWKNHFVPFLRYRDLKRMNLSSSRTNLAAQLFFAARHHRKQKTRQMFQQLIDACLLQGEIIVVAFLFAFLVKQWQVRQALSADSTDDTKEKAEWISHVVTSYGDAQTGRMDLYTNASLLNDATSLSRTLKLIKATISGLTTPESHAVQPTYEEAVQALAILAGMLSEGLLRNSSVATLISILTSFPSSPRALVFTQKKGCPGCYERRDAREYFDEVLDEVLTQVTTGGSYTGYKLSTYNSILHYALSRKLSPSTGESIIRRMQKHSIAPDTNTLNILLRAGTRLRRRDMSEAVLSVFRERKESMLDSSSEMGNPEDVVGVQVTSSHDSSAQDPVTVDSDSARQALGMEERRVAIRYTLPDSTLAMLPEKLRAVFLEEFKINLSSISDVNISTDISTLCAFIEHLIKTGSPGSVVDIVFYLIPELKLLNDSISRSRSRKDVQCYQRRAEERAAALGPYFLTSVLSAVVKIGSTGLADRIWELAKKAEKRSWELCSSQTAGQDRTYPWVLPTAAYTLMLQCYAAEMRRGLRLLCMKTNRKLNWTPQNGERHVWSWAEHVTRRLKWAREKSGFDVGRLKGAEIIESMKTSGQQLYSQLMDEQKETSPPHVNIQLPVPDERFFNAALRLLGSLPGSFIPERRTSPSHWRRLNKRQLDFYLKEGKINFPQDAFLIELVKEMHAAGFHVPDGYKHMLIGVYIPPPSGEVIHKRLPSPYGDPPKRYKSHYLHTSKIRGLPVSYPVTVRQIAAQITE